MPVLRFLLTAWAGHELDGANARGRTPLHEVGVGLGVGLGVGVGVRKEIESVKGLGQGFRSRV